MLNNALINNLLQQEPLEQPELSLETCKALVNALTLHAGVQAWTLHLKTRHRTAKATENPMRKTRWDHETGSWV